MKMVALFAAAAAVLSIPAASATGSAPVQERVVTRTTTVTTNRHVARRPYWRRVCTTSWRHHQRIRTCRRVRAWR
jgi:hypothetical protein